MGLLAVTAHLFVVPQRLEGLRLKVSFAFSLNAVLAPQLKSSVRR